MTYDVDGVVDVEARGGDHAVEQQQHPRRLAQHHLQTTHISFYF